jgi:competence protein ComEA
MKRILTDYLQFTKRERRALVVLLLLIAVCIAAPYCIPEKEPPQILLSMEPGIQKDSRSVTVKNASGETGIRSVPRLFFFDPNTASASDWQQLGVSAKLTATILRYRSKGGKFRTPEDLRKIWGMSAQQAALLIPYVQLTATGFPVTVSSGSHASVSTTVSVPSVIDVNTAVEKDWAALPGMNAYLAARIIRNRERLGGFSSLEQVRKTYGIADSIYQLMQPWLRADPAHIPKVDLNAASAWELQQKTGISFPLAKAIVQYRNQYGAYTQLSDLRKLVLINDSVYQYLSTRVYVGNGF